uniref:Uncharacterized protein n=1 Tax=Heterorhabditis bacteriophora TaxID=37862 RepID=A0A1I7WC16_HETBA
MFYQSANQNNANDNCRSPTELRTTQEVFCAVSDTEYLDAVDEEEGQSRSSSFDVQDDFRKRGRRGSLKSYCNRVEDELRVVLQIISEQIEKLSLAVEIRNGMLINMFKKAHQMQCTTEMHANAITSPNNDSILV